MAAVAKCPAPLHPPFNVCHCSSPVNELPETAMRALNDCSRFYPHANCNMAENLIVHREVAVDSVHRLGQRCPSEC